MILAGRRVRALVASAKGGDGCDSPKRKDQRLEFSGKLIQLPNNLVKNQSITDFFQVVHDQETNHGTDEIFTNCPPKHRFIKNNKISEDDPAVIITGKQFSIDTIIINDQSIKNDFQTTPHRIELCPDAQTSPTSALSQLHIALNDKKRQQPKARRRIISPSNNNQIIRPVNDETVNHILTEYFPVRRSVRKTKRTVLEEKQRNLEKCVREKLETGLEVKPFDEKGRGVVASQAFNKGDFVVEYRGELIDMSEAKRREDKYAQDHNTGCYMYYFKHKNNQYCVDATAESGYLGRLVNHSRNGNLVTKTLLIDGIPRLVLIAKDDILAGEEVTYDYGDRSKESLKYHPWLAS